MSSSESSNEKILWCGETYSKGTGFCLLRISIYLFAFSGVSLVFLKLTTTLMPCLNHGAPLGCTYLEYKKDWALQLHFLFGFSALVVLITDFYLFYLLRIAAIRCDKKARNQELVNGKLYHFIFPTRVYAIYVSLVIFATLIVSFADIYLYIHLMQGDGVAFEGSIDGMLDVIYFSFVTITTLGYGDIFPVSDYAKWAVMLQLLSGFLLLFGFFPLLISRISDFTKPEKTSIDDALKLVKEIDELSENQTKELKGKTGEMVAILERYKMKKS